MVTSVSSIKKGERMIMCDGRSSRSPSSSPIRNIPPGTYNIRAPVSATIGAGVGVGGVVGTGSGDGDGDEMQGAARHGFPS